MINQSKIHVHRMIIHKVDHRNYDAPQLSDLESPVTDEVGSFLRQHIVSNREHRHARTARFLPAKEGQVSLCAMCDCLLNHPDQFVPQSQEIAKHLFRTIHKDKRIWPGDLILCTFTEQDDDSEWLALLKMDPEDGFICEREEVNGQVRSVLRRVLNALPRGDLQKCAFILPPNLREERGHDLKVLDQQAARYGARRLIASYFVVDFLQCKLGLDRGDRTRTFVYGSYEWLAGKKEQWSKEDIERFKRRVMNSLQDAVVDATSFAAAVIRKPHEQDEYLKYLREQGLEDLTFEPADLSLLLALCQDTSLSSYEKGRALESLAKALFEPCFDADSNLRSETGEVDLWLERNTTAPFWTDYGAIAIAECKNRSEDYPVTSSEVSVLTSKCIKASARLGFFVSLGPFTRDALTQIRDQNVQRRDANSPLIVPVRHKNIEGLIRSKEKTEDWLRTLVRWSRQDKKGFYNYGFKRRRKAAKKEELS